MIKKKTNERENKHKFTHKCTNIRSKVGSSRVDSGA